MNPTCQLYLITPPQLDLTEFAPRLARALDAGPVAAVQLRLRDVDDDTVRRAIDTLRPITHERDVAFLVNDRPDLAVQTGCDGAHIGTTDGDITAARRILGDELQLGVSCYDSRELGMLAGENGADYVAFGAIYESPTKQTDIRAELSLLNWWAEIMELPAVAVGGLTAENCAPVVQAGADFLAVVSAVWSHPDGPAKGVKSMLAAIVAAEAGMAAG